MKTDLVVIILTFNLTEEVRPAKFLPKVCHKIEDKTMIEIAVENSLKLNPSKIILYVSKNNIQCINKTLKHQNYSKSIFFCIFDNELNGPRKLSIGKCCFENKNVLFIPGNSPLLSTKTMFRMVSENKNIKVENNLFYLKKDSLNLLDKITEMEKSDFLISNLELKKVETKPDLDEIVKIFEDRKKRFKKYKK
jgi:bifunctional N-acetylglucosamine-1-phosphate-uridyltransferase/glucosamine-1-phosphate-acetyltransferase GlmU-like protein